MKKILFATTALVATAGVAAADIDISGSAAAGLYSDNRAVGTGGVVTAADSDGVYSMMKIVATASGEADNGMTFGASIDASAGRDYDRGDFEYDGAEAGTFGLGNVYIATGGLKVTFDQDGVDDLENDDNSHDIQIDYTVGDFSVSLTNDVDGDNVGGGANSSTTSYKIGFAAAGVSVTVKGSDADDSNVIDLGYDVSDALNLKLHLDQNGGDQETRLIAGYTMGSVTLGAEYATYDTQDDDWDLSVGYSEGVMGLNASTNEDDEWEIAGTYSLGGGMTAEAGINHEDDYYLGVAMTF